ncbi:16S rRNA (cytidine(1402)-2'-O)-methyltransferase [Thalassococcus sp. S3]|uniref:16S rRNA (cytidine(1402)-2'-O)-methyltransferase n=1 Tax=Thalassococcus sp. S3 TaxID=2017482 RepID=UPI001023F684|nr:16S rRNA (cytidine(1402)-2'-O)-methyltransferase [Thalassococcus sp. S3]QBF33597.1 16S rRNA (cytidine(1402)-2'-O)-methyltransferase [Thalassococcus sp. S3]
MNHQNIKLQPGLYLVGTPIGTARDITLRALDILASADLLVAEDTRSMRKLLDIHGVPLADRPLFSHHDHSGQRVTERVLQAVGDGQSVAYASEAGMPMIADPGFELARAISDAGYSVTSAPGPSAAITALALAGLPTDAFFFAGFLPSSATARKARLEALREVPGTLIFYESPRRVKAMLEDARATLGGRRDGAICRELTKKFEEIKRGTLQDLAETAPEKLRGEVVVLIGRADPAEREAVDIDAALRDALTSMSVKDAAEMVSKAHGLPKRSVYQRALTFVER